MRRKVLFVNACPCTLFRGDAAQLTAAVDGQMSEPDSVELASRRLALALDALEAAAERRREADRSEEALAAQIQALGGDRARLASELDQAAARSRGLEAAGHEAAQKIDVAIETIRSLLSSDD